MYMYCTPDISTDFVKKLLMKRCIKYTCTAVLMVARKRQLWKIRKTNFGKLERISSVLILIHAS